MIEDPLDRYYKKLKDDMLTKSYEDNCKRYGKRTVDEYIERKIKKGK